MFYFLLQSVKAYHIKWAQLKPDSNIAKWCVHLIELDQNKRHLDNARMRTFWETLDQYVDFPRSDFIFLFHIFFFFRFIAKNRPTLRY